MDCGGGVISFRFDEKDDDRTCSANSDALPASSTPLVETIADLAGHLPPTDRVTVGMPGMIRHGIDCHPHYIQGWSAVKGPAATCGSLGAVDMRLALKIG